MPSRPRTRLPGWIDRLYARLLRAYPAAFQEAYASEMRSTFRARWRDERDEGGLVGVARLSATLLLDIVRTAPREHLDMLIHDVRYAWRSLSRRQNWSFSLAAILTLGLGIGAVTAIFSILYAVLLAPMPYRDGDRVVRIFETNLSRNIPTFAASIPNFADWRARSHSFSGIAGIGTAHVNLTGGGQPERARALSGTANLFDVLGLAPVMGRAFLPEDDLPGQAHIALISTGLWKRRYASDPAIVGRTLGVDGVAHTIVGVMPQDVGFQTDVDLWLPMVPEPARESRGNHKIAVVARLAPGVSIAAADAEMNQVAAAIEQDFPGPEKGWRVKVTSVRDWIVTPTLRQRLDILFVAVSLLLLVACINVANLQLARATGRLREIGVRVALGASRARLVRQMITENLVLAIAGGTLGVTLAWFSISLAKASLPDSIPRLDTLSLNLPVLLIAFVAIVPTALIAGLVPATLIARANVHDVLQQGGRSSSGARRSPLRQALVAIQLGLATMLVIGAALLAQSLWHLQNVAVGVTDPDSLLLARLARGGGDEQHERNVAFYDATLTAVRALPGVVSVGLTSEVPLGDANTTMTVGPIPRPEGVPPQGIQASWRVVTNDYLATLQVPVKRGRLFDQAQDPKNPLVLSESLVHRLWPQGQDPIGRQIWMSNGKVFNIIGVVGDLRQTNLSEPPTPTFYFPHTRFLWPTMTLVVRVQGDPSLLGRSVREAVAKIDPNQPIYDVRTLRSVVNDSAAEPRLNAVLLTSFAALALLLAGVGVAGVVGYAVVQRTPELAVRQALGASPRQAMQHVMQGGLRMCILGIVAGTAAAADLGHLLSGVLFGVEPSDPITFLVTGVALLLIAVIACWLPARRATRIDPALALRGE
jgi:putative ABC transport system permease protein